MTEISLKSTQPPADSDVRLVQAAIGEDLQARERLALRLMDRVRTTVMYMVGPGRTAEDMAQVALVEILRGLAGFRGEGSLESWADRVTRRTVGNLLKQRWRKKEVLTLNGGPRSLTDPEPGRAGAGGEGEAPGESPEREVGRREVARRLAGLISKLKPKHRWVVILRWVHGYSWKEIAEQTDTGVNTVRDRLRTGMKKLRKMILRDPVLKDWQRLLEE